tara:strand:+ start:1444 stop:2205 length:762 start_codon:yes stop_codon:yes gene_type:complete
MKKHVHIYSSAGPDCGALGWVLEKSPTYASTNFKLNEDFLDKINVDPWDNHSQDHNHWSHKMIEAQELDDPAYVPIMEDIINSNNDRSVWGISYGAWDQKEWESNAYKIGITTTDENFDYYWKLYANRPIDDIQESMNMHIHDHHQDNPQYREYMYTTFADYLKEDEVPFWKLQSAFWWGFKECAKDEDVNKAKKIARSPDFKPCYPADFWIEDIFDLDLEDLCNKIDCIYTEEMQQAYDFWVKWAKEQISDN